MNSDLVVRHLVIGQLFVAILCLSACGGGGGTEAEAEDSDSPSLKTALGASSNRLSRPPGTASAAAAPTGVYVDSALGNDANPGTSVAPWKTLAKLASSTTLLAPGQSVNLKCGSVWREAVMLDGHTFGDGTKFTGYGNCSAALKAVITGADDFSSGWTKSGNVWSKQLPTSTPTIAFLYVNGAPMRVAQWPTYGGIGREYAIASSTMPQSTTSLMVAATDLSTLINKDLAGATIQVRTHPWIIEKRTVSSLDATGKLVLTTPTQYANQPAEGYVLQNKLWMLDAPGEFFHDKATGKLYVWPSDAATQTNLNAALVEGSVRDTPLQLRNRANLSISNISFTKARLNGLQLVDTANAVVDAITADDNGANGILLSSSSSTVPGPAGSVVKNSLFRRNALAGIEFAYISKVSVLNNSVSSTGMSPYAGNSNAGIDGGPAALIKGNTVTSSAQVGIYFSGTGGSQVLNNVVIDSSQRLSDGGGIKTRNGSNSQVDQFSTVDSNIIVRVPGNAEGSVGGASDWAAGVYLDDYTIGSTVSNNFIVAAAVGISVHNASHNVIKSNRVALSSNAALFANMDQTVANYMIGNIFTLNQWMTAGTSSGTYPALPQPSSPPAVMFWHSILGTAAISSTDNNFTSNQFQLPTGSSSPVASVRSSTMTASLSIQDWIALNRTDSLDAAVPQYSTSLLNTGPNIVQGGAFDTGLGDWTAYTQATSPRGVISPSAMTGCVGLCAVLQSGSINDNISAPTFNMVPGALYYLSYTASFGNTGSIARPNIRRTVAPYDSFAGSRTSTSSLTGTASATTLQETYFIATSADPATLALQAQPGTHVGYDNVSLRQVLNYTFAAPPEWVSYAHGTSTTGFTSVSCATLRWPSNCRATDIRGNAVAFPVMLPPGTGSLYLRADSSWRKP